MNKRRILFTVLIGLVLITFLGAGAFVYWANDASQPMPEALAALKSDDTVEVQQVNDWLVFQPTGQAPKVGLIIYPGAKVDYRAYAPTARAIAAQGYLVVITPVLLNLALLDSNAAQPIIAAYPQIQMWALAGHSLGGTAAAQFAAQSAPANSGKIKGLIFWASYPAGDMTQWNGKVLSISGTLDGLATPAKIEDNKKLEPSTTQFVPIAGGNHAQFGYYGPQPGDNAPTISREAQQQQIVAATVAFLQSLNDLTQ